MGNPFEIEPVSGHEPVEDFPSMLDLGDVVASYEDFPDQLRRKLRS